MLRRLLMQPAAPLAPDPRRVAAGIALLSHDRIVAASPALADLTGYTRGELTSPEFSLAHLFARGSPPPPKPAEGSEVASDVVVVAPLRGGSVVCRRSVLRIGGDGSPLVAIILEPGDAPAQADASEAKLEVGRALVRACSSQLAVALMRLRRIQLRIEDVEHAHPEVLFHEMRRAGQLIEALEKLESDVEVLSRAAGAGAK